MTQTSSLHSYPRLVIAGTQSGVGKTTLSLAVMAALSRRGLAVQPFKVGPDYIDPSLHQLATNRHSHNLDAWLVSHERLSVLFRSHAPCEDVRAASAGIPLGGISIIEGVMGLFDGQGNSPISSTAHVAALIEAPVVLVVNAQGMSLSAAALVSGFAGFGRQLRKGDAETVDLENLHIAGIILNRVSGKRHYAVLKPCIEDNTGIPCLGFVNKGDVVPLPERHLGLVPATELSEVDALLDNLTELAEESLDIPALLAIARAALPLERPVEAGLAANVKTAKREQAAVRIGVPRDEAFSFYYPDNLEILKEMGAELCFFSPLRSSHLPPDLGGLYIGGGFPEVFADALEANSAFRSRLATSLDAGLPAYAECGGMLYLCSSLSLPDAGYRYGMDENSEFAMAGFFPEKAEMTSRLQPFGYVTVTLLRDCILGAKGTRFKAHEFHYACLTGNSASPLYHIEKVDGRSWNGGLAAGNVVAGFPHIMFHGCPDIAETFIASCRKYKLSGALLQ